MLRGTVLFSLVLILGIGLTPLFGQRGGASSGASSGITNISQPGMHLSGHVAFEDGSAPTEKVVIQSMCSGRTRDETTMDRKGGGFGFTLGQGSGDLMLDSNNAANHAGPVTSVDAKACAVQAVLVGYTSDVIYLANLQPNKPDVGTIVLHKAAGAAPGSVSETSKQASKDAHKAFDKGAEAAKNGKWPDAATNFRKAADLSPGYADAWLELGKAQLALKQVDEARKSFEAAIKADEKYAPPYAFLVQLENQAQNWKAVTDLSARLFQVTPAAPPLIYWQDAAALYRLGDYDGAEKVSRDGLKADTLHQAPKIHQVLALCLSRRKDFAGAAAEVRQYLELAPLAPDVETMKTMIASLEAQAQGAPAK